MTFLWLKAFHLIAIICWFAALFYLPRLFVYHAMLKEEGSNDEDNSASYQRFITMERKLLRGIAYPSMIVTTLLGLSMMGANINYYFSQTWFLLKLVLVALLWVYNSYCHYHYLQFLHHNNTKSHRYFRVFNELPVLALIVIIILVVIKPAL